MELETMRTDNSIKELLQRGTDKWSGSLLRKWTEIFFEDRRETVYVLMGMIEQKETGDVGERGENYWISILE